jgi:GNAT superfamily N-acetyltransferase
VNGPVVIRRARPGDSVQIAAVHVAAWRSTYPGLLPDEYLAGLSVPRIAASYDRMIRAGEGIYVAARTASDGQPGPRIVGFSNGQSSRSSIAEGEISLLYVLDDWRERGLGRRLIRSVGLHLAGNGCRNAFLWVLRDNPSRWFYQRLGGRPVAEGRIRFAGRELEQTAFLWDPIDRLVAASPAAGR